MLKANEIKGAVLLTLAGRYPGRQVFTKRLPQKFERPALYVESLTKTSKPGNMVLTECEAHVRVVAFVPVDDYMDADDDEVDLAADELTELFLGGTVHAGDRELDVALCETVYGADFGAVELTLQYFDDTPEPWAPEPVPTPELIEQVFINGKEI